MLTVQRIGNFKKVICFNKSQAEFKCYSKHQLKEFYDQITNYNIIGVYTDDPVDGRSVSSFCYNKQVFPLYKPIDIRDHFPYRILGFMPCINHPDQYIALVKKSKIRPNFVLPVAISFICLISFLIYSYI